MSVPPPNAALGAAAVLSVADAAAWLPMAPGDAETWLRAVRVVKRLGVGHKSVEVVVWGDVVDAIRNDARDKLPLTKWKEIAAACGVSEDTLARRRAAARDGTKAWFADAEAAQGWFAGLVERDVAPAETSSPNIRGQPQQLLGSSLEPTGKNAAVRRDNVTTPTARRARTTGVPGTVDWNMVARGR